MDTHALAGSLIVATLVACGAPTARPPAAPPPVAAPAPQPAPVVVATPPAPVSDLAQRRKALADLVAEQWESTMSRHPEFATVIGDHRYDDRWSDRSLEAIDAEHAADKAFLARFTAIDTAGFPEQEALSKELMVFDLQLEVDDLRFEDWLMPVNQMSGPHLRLPQLVAVTRFETVDDYEHYLARLHGIPRVFEQVQTLLDAGIAKGLMPPKILLVQTVPQARGLAKGKPAASPFAQPVTKFPAAISPADQARLRAAVLAAIEHDVQPAYARFARYLETKYVPHGRAEPGEWALPDGDARYAAAVRESTTTSLTPDQIHQIGLDEVARIEAAEAAVATKLGFKDLAALRAHVAGDRKLYAASRADILARFETYTAQMYDKLPSLFGHLPAGRMKIEEVESFREKGAPGAEYNSGTPDGSRPGVVRVNTSEPTKRLWLDFESTAYHEGVPGHHLQIAIQQELGELPMFRREGGYTAYVEGWALYAERLGEEVGFYQDPWSRYGHLEDDMLRAIRLVVDTGLHAKRWTRAQVVKFFHDHSAIDEVDVQAETDRYIAWPAQALGYKIGQLTILRLRAEAQAALGPRFDLRAFHDEVLGAGALPLDVLERRIHAWTARSAAH
ncbi:MAG TPA: DUF885 domain-containing protein [Kofleriaceae bacterium]|jgi:uncharacterized protein (DUF885 family)